MAFPFYLQYDQMDCGPTCIRIIAKYYKKSFSLKTLRDRCKANKEGVNLLGISKAAESIGFRTLGAKLSLNELENEITLPCIVHWNQNHFVVVYKITKNRIYVSDPAQGILNYTKSEFLAFWTSANENGIEKGITLIMEPSPTFFKQEEEKSKNIGIGILYKYIINFKGLIFQLFLGLFLGSILQLILPFLTKSIVDIGINNKNLNFIYLILFAQLMLIFGRTTVEMIRGWILLHVSTRINVSILTDFFIKIMQLPMPYFDTKMTGDVMQRISDHERIEKFMTNSSLVVLFSIFNLIAFSYVLAVFSIKILMVFIIGSSLYIIYILLFLNKRRELDYKKFAIDSKNQNITIQLIQGMQEIKLNNCERRKRWEWEYVQARLFKWNIQSLKLEQYQQAGALFLNEGKNIILVVLAAQGVINGNLTLGAMLAITYIIGQLNSPIEQLIYFFKNFQDAKISLDRLNEIHEVEDEMPKEKSFLYNLPINKSIFISDISFAYVGEGSKNVLIDLSLSIPEGKITAIVGASGSGKTTLLKLLLKFYEPLKGNIKIGDSNLDYVATDYLRSKCGVVMQDGFIFSDTISNNIAVSEDEPDIDRLLEAVKVANISHFIESLPLGFNTKIGAEGNGVSQGQKQRILIARAVYKNPEYIFFDEATNALDANNEKVIMRNLNKFFKGRTVIVVAHRLSTVKNADQIVVLDNGRISELGNHEQLTEKKGKYFNLVKNQLELGT
ncbi:peptidase domain-containing ABC transporter [Mesonia sp.]|uniref:peptidase domain-containing ABC transporter n=1 Tax=Mesonia sp. TaxID=1960830 RepID=UPI000C8D8369|nr:peptidase domain-containing ABC transporter [Mesonia sp.]MAN25769.1 ABC transporter ATP-binding protein [Mesonia sp.]|tara:strand:- start:613 stop:2799 length:2187 start_codon:yes stop_codon:yes gene_type:complete